MKKTKLEKITETVFMIFLFALFFAIGFLYRGYKWERSINMCLISQGALDFESGRDYDISNNKNRR